MDSFDSWFAKVDANVSATVGLSVSDLPDCPFRDWFEDGISPSEAAEMTLEEAGWDA
jgi:hypothetical protein